MEAMHLDPKKVISLAIPVISKYDCICLAYLFGSSVSKNTGPLSDYDFAIYTDLKNSTENFNLISTLIPELSLVLNTDAVDVISLKADINPEIKFSVIFEGTLFYEKEPYKVIVEPAIMNEYFDFKSSLQRNGITK